MDSIVIDIRTGNQPVVHDLTHQVAAFCRDRGDGLVHVFVPHATCGVAVIETGAGSDLDVLTALDRMVPRDDRWQHQHGATGHGADHVIPAFVAPQVSLPVIDGVIQLGTWQSITLVDTNTDNLVRKIRLSFLAG